MTTQSFFVRPGLDENGASKRIVWPSAPYTRALSETGEYVPDSPFWRRRLACGDVVLCQPPAVGETHEIRG